ncbi:MAG TPA: ATP-binding protein, partial [Thermoanaerobaculia bacterium]|nr:ATP-binding protein [Thermoanaerobaculia bacterium]
LDPDVQVVICTAFSDYSWDDLLVKLDRSDRLVILKKPFDTIEVLQLADALTEKWRLAEALGRRLDDLELRVSERTADLRDSERRYRLLFDGNPVPTWVYDVETLALLAVNENALALYGYTRDEMLALSLLDLHPSEGRERFRAAMEGTHGAVKSVGVFPQLRKDGALIQADVTTHDLTFSGRRARMALAVDVTERNRLEDQLRQAQKMEAVGQLAGGIAHDFNNIITVILGYGDLLASELEGKDHRHEYLSEVRLAAERAAALTRQLLAFSRKQVLEPRVLDLNEVVSGITPMLRRLIGEDVELTTALADDLAAICADPGQVEQVVMNLVVNARDAMPRGGRLTIATANGEVDGQVELVVRDTGTGMDAETRMHLFEPFFTTKPVGQGTGLGLATVYGIVRQSGGDISVASDLGHGTTFTVSFPALDGDSGAGALEKPAAAAARGGHETILLVEDEAPLRELNTRILREHGYDVIVANGGESALALASERTGRIDLLLTDVVMPGLSGSALAQALLEKRPETLVVYTSGYTSDALVRHGVSDATAAFLAKPFTPRALAKRVREVLDAPLSSGSSSPPLIEEVVAAA